MEKAKSTKEKDIYLLDDYAYRFDYIIKDETTKVYRCTKKECKGCFKDFKGALSVVTPHNFCVPNPAKQSIIKLCNRIKEDAENLYVTPRQIILSSQPAISLEEAAIIPSYNSSRQQINLFPLSLITGCHFHLCQCVFRKIQKIGHQITYGTDEEFRSEAKMLVGLAYILPNDVISVFKEIDLIQEITDLVNYFEEIFVGVVRRVEGWHRAFSRMVGSDQFNIYTILKNIILEQNNTENLITSMSVGNNFREATRESYRILHEKINFVLGSYS
ncbi:hypothetical protein HZS_2500, partial [Henneguya salminicola]